MSTNIRFNRRELHILRLYYIMSSILYKNTQINSKKKITNMNIKFKQNEKEKENKAKF